MERILITGGAGFLGRAILAHAAKENPGLSFTIYSRDEGKQERVRRLYPQHRYILGDVRDADRLELAVAGHDTIIHAAAMKYVPQGESNVDEAIAVNVVGSKNVARAAIRQGVEEVIGISTDKACQPVNVYGMTKAMMERLFQEADTLSDTKFFVVRYGNVVGSTGSVIPMFQRQIKEMGAVTLTDARMTRFWLSVDAAVALIINTLQAPGAVVIPRLASMRMDDLARACAFALGVPEPTFMIIGIRPGEKLEEELLCWPEVDRARKVGAHLMVLHRTVEEATEDANNLSAYTSSKADRRIGIEEMAEMIRAVPE